MQPQQPTRAARPIVNQPTWISAFLQDNLLMVYRSVKLRDTDPLYAPVAELLAGWHGTLLKMTVDDTNMMFGAAEVAFYELGGRYEYPPFGITAQAV